MNLILFYIDIIRESSVSKSDMNLAFPHFVLWNIPLVTSRSRIFNCFGERTSGEAVWRVLLVLIHFFLVHAFFVSSMCLLFLDMNFIN